MYHGIIYTYVLCIPSLEDIQLRIVDVEISREKEEEKEREKERERERERDREL